MNVLYIHTHDTGRHTSVYGKNTPTGNLLGFAKDALVFRHAFCVSPTCSPSRAAMLTGQYPHNNGMMGLTHRGFSLSNPQQHLAAYLGRAGYKTVLCGIQHESGFWLDAESTSSGLGYQQNITTPLATTSGDDYYNWDLDNARQVVDFIENHAAGSEQNFFLSYGLFCTHRAYPQLGGNDVFASETDYIDLPHGMVDTAENREDTARLHKSLQRFDDCFGMVIDALKNTGLYENTVILSTTDHGLANPFSKCTLTDDGLGVSLLMRCPGKPQSYGKVEEGLVSHIDVYPTLCDLLGLEKPQWLEGQSFAGAFSGKGCPRTEVFSELNFHTSYEPARSVRTARYKLVRYYDDQWQRYNLSNCDESPAKALLISLGWPEKEKQMDYLFDLYFDPDERQNLVDDPAYAEVYSQLSATLGQWQQNTKDHIVTFADYNGKYRLNKKDCLYPSIRSDADAESTITAAT